MKELLIQNGFIKIDGLDRWFKNFQGRTYYIYMDGGKWWVMINKNGCDIILNQTGYTNFDHIRTFLKAITLNEITF